MLGEADAANVYQAENARIANATALPTAHIPIYVITKLAVYLATDPFPFRFRTKITDKSTTIHK